MQHLDSNVLDLILKHLCAQDLLHVERVSRHLRDVSQQSTAWKTYYERQYDVVEVQSTPHVKLCSWKQVYKAAYVEEKRKDNWKVKGQIFKLTSDVQVPLMTPLLPTAEATGRIGTLQICACRSCSTAYKRETAC